MSDTCPKCEAAFIEQDRGPHYECGTWGAEQSDRCRIRELETENARLRADKERLLEAWRVVREQPNITLGQRLLIDAVIAGESK